MKVHNTIAKSILTKGSGLLQPTNVGQYSGKLVETDAPKESPEIISIRKLTGTEKGDDDLGIMEGSSITNNLTIKEALIEIDLKVQTSNDIELLYWQGA